MANHKFYTYWEIKFDDGTTDIVEYKQCYYFIGQKDKYLISWLEQLIKDKNINAKPIEIIEKTRIEECDDYRIVIGV